MPQSAVKFNLNDDGLGRQLPRLDHVSCLLFENVSQPPTWGADQMRPFRSLSALENSGVIASDPSYGEYHYQVSEFFRQNPDGEIYLGFDVFTAGSVAQQAALIMSYTSGRVRQFGGYVQDASNAADWQNLLVELERVEAPAVAVLGVTDPVTATAIPDLHSSFAFDKCALLCVGDGGALGASYADALGLTYLPAVGAVLGGQSRAGVQESIAHVERFNLSDGVELENPVFSDGTPLSLMLTSVLDEFYDKGWIYLRKYTGVAGTYPSDNRTATALTSDYSSLNINRVVQKAVRGVRAALVPKLNSTVPVDPVTGGLGLGYISNLETIGSQPLLEMQRAGELSGYQVTVPSGQSILSTSQINVTVVLVPIGIGRRITVDLSLSTNV